MSVEFDESTRSNENSFIPNIHAEALTLHILKKIGITSEKTAFRVLLSIAIVILLAALVIFYISYIHRAKTKPLYKEDLPSQILKHVPSTILERTFPPKPKN